MLWIIIAVVIAGVLVAFADGEPVDVIFIAIVIGVVGAVVTLIVSLGASPNKVYTTTYAINSSPACASLQVNGDHNEYVVTQSDGTVKTLSPDLIVKSDTCYVSNTASHGPRHFWLESPWDAMIGKTTLHVTTNGLVVK